MKLTEHRLNILKILHYDCNSYATAGEMAKIFQKHYGRPPGNIYEDLNDLCALGFATKDEAARTYTVTEKGMKLLSVKCGDPPKLELVYNGIIIEKIKLTEELYHAIQSESKKENQSIEDWVIGNLEIAAGVEHNAQPHEDQIIQ